MRRASRNQTVLVAGLMLLSWLGMIAHNRAELPMLAWYRPEYVGPSLLSLILFLGWWRMERRRRFWRWLILAWSSMHFIIGGILSVLPLPIWPFVPEQSLGHYSAHLVYSLFQIPILVYLARQLLASKQSQENESLNEVKR